MFEGNTIHLPLSFPGCCLQSRKAKKAFQRYFTCKVYGDLVSNSLCQQFNSLLLLIICSLEKEKM